MEVVKLNIECQSCGGTGVYVGMAEHQGASVVCHNCSGTGCEKYSFEYNLFKERRKANNVKRVFITGYGYCLGTELVVLDNKVSVDFSKEGVSYKEFLDGKMPKHIKQMGCPFLVDQSACRHIDGFVNRCEKINGGYISLIRLCKCEDKIKCWDRFEDGKK